MIYVYAYIEYVQTYVYIHNIYIYIYIMKVCRIPRMEGVEENF